MLLRITKLCCSTDRCIKYLVVLVSTSDIRHAGTVKAHNIGLQAKGELKTTALETPPEGLVANGTNEWKLSLEKDFQFSGCVKVRDIENLAILENHNDGWNINSVVTFLVVDPCYWALSSVDFDVNVWIDGNSDPSYKEFNLTLFI